MNIGYLGPRGTFTEEAATRLFPAGEGGAAPVLIPYRTIPEVLADVEAGKLDRGVVPIENSIEGSVAVTLDALVHEVEVYITAEVVLPIRHHLMVRPGVSLEEIEGVISHPQALAQCRKSLDRLLPHVPQSAATSTAEAAAIVARSDRPLAALGNRLAATLNGLEVLKSDLQDLEGNATRFVAVGRELQPPTGHDKTSVVFAFGVDRPGNLCRWLTPFAERQVNLVKLESRPAKRSLGDYIFFADVEGHLTDQPVQEALAETRDDCAFFKVLGAYPRVDYQRSNNGG